jgi:hypothetical protein
MNDADGREQAGTVQILLDSVAGRGLTETEKARATELLRAVMLLLTVGVRLPYRLEGFRVSTTHGAAG